MFDFKLFRQRKKIGQKVLIDLFSCTQGYVSALETGRKQPTKEQMRLLEEAFGDLTQYITADITNTNTPESYSINQEQKGTPYYDVDFIGGFDLVYNDQSVNPTYHIQFQAYENADCWVNITGHSMEPLISHGDIVALKKIEDWHTYVLYGETYAIVTDEYRTVKKIRKSTKGDDFIRLVPVNIEFDEQDINKSIIRHVYQVLGCAKKIF